MKPRVRPKTESQIERQLYTEAMRAQCLDALRRDYPEVTVNEVNIGFAYSTGSWNNGRPCSAAMPSLSISLHDGEERTIENSNKLPAVYVHKQDVDRLVGQANGLLFALFGIDNALAFTSIPKEITYRVTKYNKYAVPVEDFRFLTIFADPTTEMRKERFERLDKKNGPIREQVREQVRQQSRRIEEAIESNKLKVGDDVLWTDPSTKEVINYGIIMEGGRGELWVVQSKPKQITYIDDRIRKQCLRRSRQRRAKEEN